MTDLLATLISLAAGEFIHHVEIDDLSARCDGDPSWLAIHRESMPPAVTFAQPGPCFRSGGRDVSLWKESLQCGKPGRAVLMRRDDQFYATFAK